MQEDASPILLGQVALDHEASRGEAAGREASVHEASGHEASARPVAGSSAAARAPGPQRSASVILPHAPPTPEGQRPFLTIVMPALNEEKYIESAIVSVLPDLEDDQIELLVMDGGSTDATREIVSRLSAQDPRIQLVHNEGRLQSAGVNLAAGLANSNAAYLVRADCHAIYPPGFARACVDTIMKFRAASVVIAMRTRGRTPVQTAIAAAQNSRLGNGGSAHRRLGLTGFVDHGHHAAFDRNAFRAVGGYDETCPYNEDAELDKRIVSAGGRIYLNGNIAIDYFPRDSLKALARQYANHGWGRANTLLKHGGAPQIRQILPVFVLLGCVAGLILGLTAHPIFLVAPLAYVAAAFTWGAVLAAKQKSVATLLSGPAAVVMHMAWATGFLKRIAQEVRSKMNLRFWNTGAGNKNAMTGAIRRVPDKAA